MRTQTRKIHPVAFHVDRLHASALYIRREDEAIEARRRAIEAAYEYCSTKRNTSHGAFVTEARP